MISKKENGSYYTPDIIADFIIKRVFDKNHYALSNNLRILEPSVGDGVFIKSVLSSNVIKNKNVILEFVERDSEELKKAINLCKKFKKKNIKILSHLDDYLVFKKDDKNKYDLIIGNPPYIKKNHLTKKQLELCEIIHKDANLSDKKIKNIWTAFLVGAVDSLNDDGVFAFVLPAELLQVSYAKELREYLKKIVNKIEIFAFNELVFNGIEQDVIIVIGEKKSNNPGISFFQVNKLDDLKKPSLIPGNTNVDRETLDKWTNYILSKEDLLFLDKFKNDLKPVQYYSKVQVGIVTAANNFFIISNSTANKYKIKDHCKKIIQKSSFMETSLSITLDDFNFLKKRDKPVFLLTTQNISQNTLPNPVKRYIKLGENNKVNGGYKCLIRNNWFYVPSVWAPEGFFIKRSGMFPRIIVNEARVNVTDAFYRITMNKDYSIKNLAFSFLNSLSLIFSELEGRYYGGGVLELIPSEFKNIPTPYIKVKISEFKKLDLMLRKKESIESILNYTNNIILKKYMGLKKKEIIKINEIYKKLVDRRLKIKINQ